MCIRDRATVINQRFRGLRLFKTFYFMPVVINRIAISLMFTFILYPKMGPVTVLLKELGIRGVNILGNYSTATPAVCLIYMWCDAGFQMIVFSSGLACLLYTSYPASRTGPV